MGRCNQSAGAIDQFDGTSILPEDVGLHLNFGRRPGEKASGRQDGILGRFPAILAFLFDGDRSHSQSSIGMPRVAAAVLAFARDVEIVDEGRVRQVPGLLQVLE